MRKASKLFLFLGVLLALLGGGALFMYLQSLGTAAAQAPATVNVLVAATDIPSFKPMTAEMLQVKSVPAASVTPDNVRDLNTATGKALSTPAKAGQQILASTLTEGGFAYSVPKGKRAQAVFVDRLSVVNGLLRDGDYVDVIYTGTLPQLNYSAGKDGKYADAKAEGPVGKTILQNLQVLKVMNPTESGAAGAIILPGTANITPGTSGTTDLWTVVLAVTDQEAERVRYAQTNGIVSLVLRPNGDTEIQETTGVSQEILNNNSGVPLPEQPEK